LIVIILLEFLQVFYHPHFFCHYTTTMLATFLSANRFYRYSPTAL
jgi:hypothetical protein